MKFILPELSYSSDALAPVIGQQTIELHHGKHFQGYINNLNNLIINTEFADAELVDIVKKSDGAIFNNAGQTLNHQLYFSAFTPKGAGVPQGELATAINSQFGDFEKFQQEFTQAGATLFGSGWVWLAKDSQGKLSIEKEANAGNPVTKGLEPILGFDVWEHSYYLDYQNRRPDHLKALWNIIDWDVVSKRY